MNKETGGAWVRNATCPNCGRHYSRDERIAMSRDEEYCCDNCKHEAEEGADMKNEHLEER